MSSFSNCQKSWRHYIEYIAVRWRDEGITMSSFSLYYTWRNDLRLHNRISNNNNSVPLLGHCCWHCRTANQNPRASNDSNALKMNIIVIFALARMDLTSPFQSSVTFYVETSHLFCTAKQITCLYMNRSTVMRWVNQFSPLSQLKKKKQVKP